jgi:DNA/RNA-binding domain of Phe-tRNA-synthetase-like protein
MPDDSSPDGAMMVEIRVTLPGVLLGYLEADGVRVELAGPGLLPLLESASRDIQRSYSVESLSEAKSTLAVRAMFRAWGVDPSKYRPSSEALLRRIIQGKGLYRVSNVVDIGNLGSIETGWPYGLYDRSKIVPPVEFRHGATGEMYEGIGKRMWHLAERPVLADSNGPFGSPISDSTRTMITESAHDILAVIYAPATDSLDAIHRALSKLGERLTDFAAATHIRPSICAASGASV